MVYFFQRLLSPGFHLNSRYNKVDLINFLGACNCALVYYDTSIVRRYIVTKARV
jgi:hypothetical protein